MYTNRIALTCFIALLLCSCQPAKDNAEDSSLSENELPAVVQTQAINDEADRHVDKRLKINVETMKLEDEIFKHRICRYNYQDESNFSFKMEGSFEMSGTLSYGENSGLNFNPSALYQNMATIISGEIEKPLYLWTEFRNEDELLASISAEMKERIDQMEMPEVTLVFKNYEVVACGYHIYGFADFLEIIPKQIL